MVEDGPFTLAAMILFVTFTFVQNFFIFTGVTNTHLGVRNNAAAMLPTAVAAFYVWKKRSKAKRITIEGLLYPIFLSCLTVLSVEFARHNPSLRGKGMTWVNLATQTSSALGLRTGFGRWLSRARGIRRQPIEVLLEHLLPLSVLLLSIGSALSPSWVAAMVPAILVHCFTFFMSDRVGWLTCKVYVEDNKKEKSYWRMLKLSILSVSADFAALWLLVKGIENKFLSPMAGAKDESFCSICFGRYWEGDRRRLLVSCGHMFHPHCVNPWLRTKKWCPLCRVPARRKCSHYSNNVFGSSWWSRQLQIRFFP